MRSPIATAAGTRSLLAGSNRPIRTRALSHVGSLALLLREGILLVRKERRGRGEGEGEREGGEEEGKEEDKRREYLCILSL